MEKICKLKIHLLRVKELYIFEDITLAVKNDLLEIGSSGNFYR